MCVVSPSYREQHAPPIWAEALPDSDPIQGQAAGLLRSGQAGSLAPGLVAAWVIGSPLLPGLQGLWALWGLRPDGRGSVQLHSAEFFHMGIRCYEGCTPPVLCRVWCWICTFLYKSSEKKKLNGILIF